MKRLFTITFLWFLPFFVFAQNSQVQNWLLGPDYATNGATGVSLTPWIGIANDPNFVETSVEIQISESNTFNSLVYQNLSSVSTTQTETFYRRIPSSTPLSVNKLYYLRVRSFVNSTPSSFSNVVTFTTRLPIIRVDQPSEGKVLSTLNVSFTSTTEPGVTHYTWELEETSPLTRMVTSRTITSQATKFSEEFLERGKSYRVRVRGEVQTDGTVAVGPFSPWRNFSMAGNIFLPSTYVVNVDGNSITSSTDLPYANKFTYSVRTVFISGATRYNWQFDDSNDFASLNLTVSTNTNVLNLQTTQLESGKLYYVRVQAANTNTGETSNISTSPVRRFYNSLYPVSLSAPTDFIAVDGNTALFAPIVANATDIIFQVDDDPNFGSPYENPSWISTNGNSIHPGIAGNVFRANRYWNASSEFGATAGNATHRAFDRWFGYGNGTYYVRVRAVNANQSGNWSTVRSIIVTLPPIFVTLTIPNGAIGLETTQNTFVTNDKNYIETSVDVQISADDFETTVYKIEKFAHRGTTQTPIPPITNLKFNTTYKARVRTYTNLSPNTPSEWVTITFATQKQPIVSMYGIAPSPWSGKGIHVYATKQTGIDQYEWQVEKTNAPTGSFTKTTTLFYTNFKEFLRNGGQYRMRVRGNAVAQDIEGVWTNWVSFTVADNAARIASPDEMAQGAETFSSFNDIVSFPNPFHDRTRLMISGDYTLVKVRINDIMGRLIEERSINGGETIELGAKWAAGIYVISIYDEKSIIKTIKVLKN